MLRSRQIATVLGFCFALISCGPEKPITAGSTAAGTSAAQSNPPPTGASATPTGPTAFVVTSGKGAYWQKGALAATSDTPYLIVNDTLLGQEWFGMGGSFNEMGWDNLSLLSPGDRDNALRLLFSKDGANFRYGRIPIGANDYALSRYTLAETPDDWEMQHFTLERDRKAVIPYVKAALALNPKLHLWGSPWSPPAWMKYNNALDNGPVRYNDTDPDREAEMVKLNKIKDDDKVLQAHALYLARFVEEYAKEGISVEAVFPQNEPGFHANHYPSCGWETSLYVRYLRDYLGPTFETRKVPAQIWAGTFSSDLSSVRDGWIDDIVTGKAVAADPGAMKYVKGFGLQWNTEEVIEDAKAHQLPILQTEHKSGNYPWVKKPENCIYRHCSLFDPLKAQNDHAYAQQSWDLIRQWITWGVNGYVAWNMVLDTVGQGIDMSRPWPQDSLLVVDRDAKTLIITPAYYVFRHVSGFVDEGARVINLVNVPSDTDALAFKNPDGSIVAVLYNDGNAREVPVALGNQIFKVPLPAEGWATVYYKP